MITLRTRWRNFKLARKRRELDKDCARAAKEAKQQKKSEILDEWYGVNGWELDAIDAEQRHNITRDLIDEGNRLRVKVPTYCQEDIDKWVAKGELGWCGGDFQVLTPEATSELETAIYAKKKQRLDLWEIRAKIFGSVLTLLIGLIGSIMGLVSLLKK